LEEGFVPLLFFFVPMPLKFGSFKGV